MVRQVWGEGLWVREGAGEGEGEGVTETDRDRHQVAASSDWRTFAKCMHEKCIRAAAETEAEQQPAC